MSRCVCSVRCCPQVTLSSLFSFLLAVKGGKVVGPPNPPHFSISRRCELREMPPALKLAIAASTLTKFAWPSQTQQ